MPQMGVSVAEGTVVEWRKRVGDWVQADETICEISTDKIASGAPAPATAEGDPRSRMRRAIGEHMLRSLHTAAHCTTIVEADFSAVEAGRTTLGLTYLPIVARCVIDALREFPALNATFEGDRLVRRD